MGQAQAREVVLEVRRKGRRPRFHRGAVVGSAPALRPEQCNLDQVALDVRQLDALPEGLRRPWTQLCGRCWRGTAVLEAAIRLRDATKEATA